MEFDFDPADVSAIGAAANDDLVHAMLIIGAVAVLGLFGRVFFSALKERATKNNPLKDASGAGLILAAVLLVAGAVYYTGGHVKTMVMVQRHVVDPVIVSVLKQDSCRVDAGSYCVVVFEDDREIVVNWHDKRVHMFSLLTPPMNPPWGSPRPLARDPDYAITQASFLPPDDT